MAIDLVHDVKRTISVWWITGVVIGIAYLGWTGYITFVKPHTNPTPTTTQTATQIYNVYVYPNRKGFSLLSWGTWHILSKDTNYDLTPILKEQVKK